MLQLTRELLNQIEVHGQTTFPNEGCGLLLGYVANGNNVVTGLHPAGNSWPIEEEKPIRFRISAEDMLEAEFSAMDAGVEIVGVFHSHPNDQPIASPRDLAWATWPGYSYLITSVWDSRPGESRSWQLKVDRTGFDEETIQVVETT